MKVSILYDNMAVEGFQADWGFSCLVGESVLFDTGRDLQILAHNIKRLRIDRSKIKHVVISHRHKDHIGGIGIIEYLGDVTVYLPASVSAAVKSSIGKFQNASVIEVAKPIKITKNISSLGEIGEGIKEQSIIVETENGVSLICGCAHPGLENILEKAEAHGKIYGIIGGFHDFDRLLALEYSHLVAPCHCTEKRDEIRSLYKFTSKPCASGKVIEI